MHCVWRRFLGPIIALFFLSALPAALPGNLGGQVAQEDVLYLKDGSVVRGMIVETVPGISILIQTQDGNRFRYQMSDILRITKEPVAGGAVRPTGSRVQRPGVAQQPQPALPPGQAGYKDPSMALIFSVVISGGGHFYSGETGKGLFLLLGGTGSLIAGVALSSWDCSSDDWILSCELNYTPYYAGLAIYLGTWIYGMVDGGKAARRANVRNAAVLGGRMLSPEIAFASNGRMSLGLRLSGKN